MKILASLVRKIPAILEDWFHYVGWAGVLFLMGLVTVGVIGRYVFNKPILGEIDVSELVIGTIVFLGLAHTQRAGGHIRLDLIINKLRGRPYHLVESVILLLALVLFGSITIFSFQNVIFQMYIGDVSPTVNIPTWPFKMSVPVGCGLLCIRFGIQLFQHLARLKSGGKEADLMAGGEAR